MLRRRRKHIAFSFQLPALPNVIGHLFTVDDFSVIGLELNGNPDDRGVDPAHLHHLHGAHDDAVDRFQVRRIQLQQRITRDIAEVRWLNDLCIPCCCWAAVATASGAVTTDRDPAETLWLFGLTNQ